MLISNTGRAKVMMVAFSLAVIAALLIAVVFAAGVAEAQRGGGGRGGGGGKPSGSSTSKPSASPSPSSPATKNGSAKSGSSSVYNPGYAPRRGAFSNFFLWAWIFHDFDDDDYEEEYGEANAGFAGWAVMGAGAVGLWFLFRNLRKRL